MKLKLDELKVSSFITSLENEDSVTIKQKGGWYNGDYQTMGDNCSMITKWRPAGAECGSESALDTQCHFTDDCPTINGCPL